MLETILSFFSGNYIKIAVIVLVIGLLGGMYVYQKHLETTIADQKVEVEKFKVDSDKLISEINLLKEDKINMEKSLASLKETLDKKEANFKDTITANKKQCQILLDRKFKNNKSMIESGSTLDETTSKNYIELFNSRFFSN